MPGIEKVTSNHSGCKEVSESDYAGYGRKDHLRSRERIDYRRYVESRYA